MSGHADCNGAAQTELANSRNFSQSLEAHRESDVLLSGNRPNVVDPSHPPPGTNSAMNLNTIILVFGSALIGCLVAIGVKTSVAPSAPVEMTVSHLLEQVRGDALYWDGEGKPFGYWDITHLQQVQQGSKRFAIQELGRRGSTSKEAVPELIRLFLIHEDWDSGDGIISDRSNIARTLGAIGDPAAIDPMINLIREKASAQDLSTRRGPVPWHSDSFSYGYGYGPDGITDGLKLFGQRHHPIILGQLADLQSELETLKRPNKWTKKALAEAIKFFRSKSYVKAGDVEMIKLQYRLAEFE